MTMVKYPLELVKIPQMPTWYTLQMEGTISPSMIFIFLPAMEYLHRFTQIHPIRTRSLNRDGTTTDYPLIIDGASIAIGGQATFPGLPPGRYTAISREKTATTFSMNQCWTQSTVAEIEDRAFVPLLDNVAVIDNSVCATSPMVNNNGAITVTATKNMQDREQPGDFRFAWYNQDTDPAHNSPLQTPDDNVASSTLSDQASGDYAVEIFRVSPTLDITYISGGTFYTGESLTFSGGGAAVILADDGTDLNVYQTNATAITNGETMIGVTSGNAATITSVPTTGAIYVNGCMITEIITINDNFETHAISGTLAVTNVSDCSPNDTGSVTVANANVTSGATVDYEFAFYPTLTDAQNNTNALQGFSAAATYGIPSPAAGTYHVVARHLASGCESVPFEVGVDDVATGPVLSITNITDDTSCDTDVNEGNGSIAFSITHAVDGDYNYQWYAGTDNTPTNALTDNGAIANSNGTVSGPGAYTNITLNGIGAGTYSLEVTDVTAPNNNCVSFITVIVNERISRPTLVVANNMTIQNNQNCDSPNGSIEVTSIRENGADVMVTLTNYTFAWFKNGVAFDAPDDGRIVSTTGTNNSIADLTGAAYSVTVVNNSTLCASTSRIDIILGRRSVRSNRKPHIQKRWTLIAMTGTTMAMLL